MTIGQVDDIRKLLEALRGSDEVDIKVRKDAQDIWFEADWTRELLEAFILDFDDHQHKVDNLARIILMINRTSNGGSSGPRVKS